MTCISVPTYLPASNGYKEFMKKISISTRVVSSFPQFTPLCLCGGKEKSQGGNEGSPWKSFEKAMGGFKKEQSLEDALRQQMQKQEYYDYDDSGGDPPNGGGGGGGGSGGMNDEDPFDDFVQCTLAIIGVLVVYVFILEGETLVSYIKDIVRALCGGEKSVRLRKLLRWWKKNTSGRYRKVLYDPMWLDKQLLMTPTNYHVPKSRKQTDNTKPPDKIKPPKEDYVLFREDGGYDDRDFEIYDRKN